MRFRGRSNLFGNNTTNGTNLSVNQAGNTQAVGVGGQESTSANSFIGANVSTTNQTPQNFIGGGDLEGISQNAAGGATNGMNAVGATSGGVGGMNSGANGMGGQGEGQGNLAGANNTQTTPAVRISMKLGFVPLASLRPAEASLAVASHLAAMPALHLQTPVQVVMQGRTAILSGVVETEHDRDLAEARGPPGGRGRQSAEPTRRRQRGRASAGLVETCGANCNGG